MEKITLITSDNITLSALYYPSASPSAHGAVLLHMMPATKESWSDFGSRLASANYHAIAVDLRGHGESAGGPEGYAAFGEAEHQASSNDVIAAAEFLRTKGVTDLSVIGASIGANLALEYLADHPDAATAVPLSPGLNYHGVETLPSVDKLQLGQRVFIAASEDDMRSEGIGAADMAKQIYLAIPDTLEKKIQIYHESGHGTSMFGKEDPNLAEEIIAWLAAKS